MAGTSNSGRRRLPTAIKEMHGNKDKRWVNPDEPVYEAITVNDMVQLSGYAKEEWERIAPVLAEMGVLQVTDMAVCMAYCVAFQRFCEAYNAYKQYGAYATTEDEDGVLQLTGKRSPYVVEMDKAWPAMLKLGIELGLTPSSRARIIGMSPATIDVDPVEKYLKD